MINIIFTKGMQGSGKSTWAKSFVKDNLDYRRVSRDDLRHMCDGYSYSSDTEKLITDLEKYIIGTYIKNGYSVVIDKMNLSKESREKDINTVKSIASSLGKDVSIEIKEFPITLSEAIARDANREFSLGEKVLKNTWRKYEIELRKMLADAKPVYTDYFDDKLPWCIIFDIDGTTARADNRRIFDEEKVGTDSVIEQTVEIIRCFKGYVKDGNDVKIFGMSGRQDSCRVQTQEWLADNDVFYHDLFMRSAGDNRDDTIVKEELFNKYISGKYRVMFVMDDRAKVLNMWQHKGIFTLDVRQDAYCKNNF